MMLTISHRVRTDIRDIIVAEAGERRNKSTKEMNNSQFSLANRKQLADLLDNRYDGLRYRAREKRATRANALRKSLIEEYGEKKGATAVARQIEASNRKIQELSIELKQLGFEYDESGLQLFDDRSNPLDDIIDKRVEKEMGSRADIDARFDSAQIAMMTVASLEDAEKLLKSVSEI
jgi:hypothetical protein